MTEEQRKARADEVATQLGDHRRWLTHGRSLRIRDLEAMRLVITNYEKDLDLADAIRRYHTLLQMTFSTNIYKVFETVNSQIYRFIAPQAPAPQEQPGDIAVVEVKCGKCGTPSKVQANLGTSRPLQEGHLPFPKDNVFRCPGCAAETNLGDLRRQLEAQTKKPVVA